MQGRLFPTRNGAGTVEGLYKYAPREGAKAEKSIGKEAEKSSPSASVADYRLLGSITCVLLIDQCKVL